MKTVSNNPDINGILHHVYDSANPILSWHNANILGAPVTISYSFPLQRPSDFTGSTFRPMTSNERAAISLSMEQVESLTNVRFVQASNAANADIQFISGGLGSTTLGLAQTSFSIRPSHSSIESSIVTFNANHSSLLSFGSYNPGGLGFYTALHELGHALGLEHPFEDVILRPGLDSDAYTVMSYTDSTTGTPNSYMSLDVMALQHLYGVNTSTRSEDNVYDFSDLSFANRAANGGFYADGGPATLWDAGGVDTIDLSNVSATPGTSNTVNLNGGLASPVHILQSSEIENVIGSSGQDFIFGNDLDNVFDIRRGTEEWNASNHAARDYIDGSAGQDKIQVDGHFDDYEIKDQASGATSLISVATTESLFLNDLRSIVTTPGFGRNPPVSTVKTVTQFENIEVIDFADAIYEVKDGELRLLLQKDGSEQNQGTAGAIFDGANQIGPRAASLGNFERVDVYQTESGETYQLDATWLSNYSKQFVLRTFDETGVSVDQKTFTVSTPASMQGLTAKILSGDTLVAAASAGSEVFYTMFDAGDDAEILDQKPAGSDIEVSVQSIVGDTVRDFELHRIVPGLEIFSISMISMENRTSNFQFSKTGTTTPPPGPTYKYYSSEVTLENVWPANNGNHLRQPLYNDYYETGRILQSNGNFFSAPGSVEIVTTNRSYFVYVEPVVTATGAEANTIVVAKRQNNTAELDKITLPDISWIPEVEAFAISDTRIVIRSAENAAEDFGLIYDLNSELFTRLPNSSIPAPSAWNYAPAFSDFVSDEVTLSNGFSAEVFERFDGSRSGIFAKVFDENGNQVGDEFRVNDAIAGYQTSPLVRDAGGGKFEVIWEEEDGTTKLQVFETVDPNEASLGNTSSERISGTSSADVVIAGAGNDRVWALKGADYVDLGAGNDYVRVGGGKEVFLGGSGTDYISYYDSTGGVYVNLETNSVSGSWASNDTIKDFESVSGSRDGGDTIVGTSGANTIRTYGGNDKVYAGKGNDIVELGAGNDYVRAGGGAESFDGGSGNDYISYYDSSKGITANLAKNTVSGSWAVNDTINSFESISGSRTGDDYITGTSGANTIRTYGGNDRVFAGKGSDKIELGSGNDYVKAGGGKESFDGGSGTDYISYYDSSNGIRIDLRDDEVSGSWAVNDTIKSFESASGSKTGNDTMLGTNGANTLKGYGGDDKLIGRSGSDKLYGGDGNDFFDGGGGSGTDYLWGGDDADVFHFDRGEGTDVIKDFENNIDEIQLDNFGITKADAFAFASQIGVDVVFDFGANGMLTVENATIGQLQNDLVIV